METWTQLFGTAENSGIYPIEEAVIPDISKAAIQAGMAVFCLDLSNITGKAGFLKAVAKALQFPHHFGSNWDAFEDCLTDLSWIEAGGYILLFKKLENFSRNSPAELAMAHIIFEEAAAYWKQQGIRFFVGFTGEALPALTWKHSRLDI
jgi:RNAse (barnase) inhibitor barstar